MSIKINIEMFRQRLKEKAQFVQRFRKKFKFSSILKFNA